MLEMLGENLSISPGNKVDHYPKLSRTVYFCYFHCSDYNKIDHIFNKFIFFYLLLSQTGSRNMKNLLQT